MGRSGEIAALLWPALDTRLAFTNLRKTLHRLQRLPEAQGLALQAGALRYDVAIDVGAFEAALRERRIVDAIALRRGDLLLGCAAAQQYLAGAVDSGTAIELAARLLEADPLDEDALRHCMIWLGRGPGRGRATGVQGVCGPPCR